MEDVIYASLGDRADAGDDEGSLHAKVTDLVPRVQRGVAAGAGNITITAIDPNRSIVLSWSKGSTGRVGTNAISGTLGAKVGSPEEGAYTSGGTTSISLSQSATQTDIFVKVYSAKIVDAETISVDGACWWEVIEF